MNAEFQAIEGDFLETKENIIFDVKGLMHPSNRIIAYVRYIPIEFFIRKIKIFLDEMISSVDLNSQYRKWDEEFVKIIDNINDKLEKDSNNLLITEINTLFGIKIESIRFRPDYGYYFKVYDIQSRFDILSMIKPDYIFTSENYYFPLQAVPFSDIKKIHRPEDYIKKIITVDTLHLNEFNKELKELIYLLKDGAHIDVNNIGLTGSGLVNLSGESSDFDLIVYGVEDTDKIRKLLEKFLIKNKIGGSSGSTSKIKPYSDAQLNQHYIFRAKSFDIPIENFKFYEKRKLHQFFYKNIEVFIRYLKFNRNNNPNFFKFNQFFYKYVGRIELTAVIIDVRESMYTPAYYIIGDILINSIELNKKYEKEICNMIKYGNIKTLKVTTMRGRFIEQAQLNEKVKICGKLELELPKSFKSSKLYSEYLNIIVGVDTRDIFYPILKNV